MGGTCITHALGGQSQDGVQASASLSLVTYFTRVSCQRSELVPACAGRLPGKKDGHLTISRIPADSSLAWRLETAGSVYCVMMSHKSGASLWNVLGNENAVQCFYMLTDIKGCE